MIAKTRSDLVIFVEMKKTEFDWNWFVLENATTRNVFFFFVSVCVWDQSHACSHNHTHTFFYTI